MTAGERSTGLRAVEVDPHADPRWAAFVSAHPHGLVYQLPAWLLVLNRAYHYRIRALACEDAAGALRGILPLVERRAPLTGHRLSSLPRTPAAGPLVLDAAAGHTLVGAAVDLVRAAPDAALRLKVPETAVAELGDAAAGLVRQAAEATYARALPDHPDELRFGDAKNHGRIRWSVTKAARMGVQVREADTEADLRGWYRLYLATMRRHPAPAQPYGFFAACWDILRPAGLLRLLLAEHHDGSRIQPIAGSVFLSSGDTVYYAYNGSDRRALPLRPNDAIHWHAMRDACRLGYRRYDFGEVVQDNEGLARFKAKWGAEPTRLYRYYYPAPREVESGLLAASSPARRVVDATWRRLPLPATALLGTVLHRYA